MPDRRLVCVTDVPTPYRNHFFTVLSRELAGRGFDLEVWFMAATAPDRFWTFAVSLGEFRYRIWRGVHPVANGWAYHLNPGVAAAVLADPPRWLLLGGAWNQPTTVLAALAAWCRRRSRIIFWSEANRESATRATGPVAAARRAVLRLADAFAVPGRIAQSTITDDWGVRDREFLPLPNLIDEAAFARAHRHSEREARRARLAVGNRVFFLWPARLHEATKGIVNFLDAVQPLLGRQAVIAIAGEGPDRPAIEAWLAAHPSDGVTLLGHQPQEELVAWLGAADALLLPSLRDPNPLSVVEGLWAGLPLLISRHCGNWPEAVQPGENGWVVDPSNAADLQRGFLAMAGTTPAQRASMSEVSRRIAAHQFSAVAAARLFVDRLVAPAAPREAVSIP